MKALVESEQGYTLEWSSTTFRVMENTFGNQGQGQSRDAYSTTTTTTTNVPLN